MGLQRVLVANRGEIAVRIQRAAHALGIETVQVVSAADHGSLAAEMADRAVVIGSAPAKCSYLDPKLLLHAAHSTHCDALHPGYGFLSERADLAQLCADNDIVFIGPRAETIAALGDKLRAREIAQRAQVEITPGSDRIADLEQAKKTAVELGLPVVMKASAGGGGRGMFVARDTEDLEKTFDRASSEAREAFGDGTLYMERFVESARHVEVQVLGDGHGKVLHCGERDCSIQRRYQKLIEEAPCAALPDTVRSTLHHAAAKLLASLKYRGAGTVEFLYDPGREAVYFMEVNARIQVEHPATEQASGIDLVQQQFRIAAGEPLALEQAQIQLHRHAIECRINAEDPHANFRPCPGVITTWEPPQGAGIRLDTHCHAGYRVPPYYDSMIAKLIITADTRELAIGRLHRALREFTIAGIATNLDLQRRIVSHPDFIANRLHTRWLEQVLLPAYPPPSSE